VFHAYLLTIFSKNRMGDTLREGIRVLSETFDGNVTVNAADRTD
jgi:hypothetical protein